MAYSTEYRAYVEELLQPVGKVTTRGMFGGVGVFYRGLMFALIADDTLYLKVDDGNRGDFEAEGMKPFTYSGKGKPVSMSYWELPESTYDDPELFVEWAGNAYAAALRSKKKK